MNSLSILIIDDEKIQAESLAKALNKANDKFFTIIASDEKDILSKIEYSFYDVAIVDLRMSKFQINGFKIIESIREINPFAKVIVASAYIGEYISELTQVLSYGNILGVVDKESFDKFSEQIIKLLNTRNQELISNPDISIQSLRDAYSKLKNENDTYKKGLMFEFFISNLFGQMGFNKIINRVIDQSRNEVDLAIRNEINDGFFQKFKQYILIECKNKPDDGVSKNDFIIFQNKIKNTNGLSDLGIIATTGYIKKTTFLEALRESGDIRKIVFLSNPEIDKLINSQNRIETFKEIIDSQIKDN